MRRANCIPTIYPSIQPAKFWQTCAISEKKCWAHTHQFLEPLLFSSVVELFNSKQKTIILLRWVSASVSGMELNSMPRASLEFLNTFWKFHFQSPKSIVPFTHSSCWAKLNLHTTTRPKKTKTRFDDLWSLLKQLFWLTAVSLIIERAHLSAALPRPLLFSFFARLFSNATHFPRSSHGERLLPLPHRCNLHLHSFLLLASRLGPGPKAQQATSP